MKQYTPAWESENEETAIRAVEETTDQSALAEIAKNDSDAEVRKSGSRETLNKSVNKMENFIDLRIRKMDTNDAIIISNAFKAQGWNKPMEIYCNYFVEQENNERVTLIAEIDDKFVGYINIKWKSSYPFFLKNKIPEIVDLNVLIKYRRMGVGNKLMNKAEEIIKEQSDLAGIGVGLFSDYGQAQIMYIKRGYIPDGKGIYKNNSYITFGETVIIDDDVVLYFIKELK